jgi:hypothetical protein
MSSTTGYNATPENLRKVWSPADALDVAQRAADIPIEDLYALADKIFAAGPAPLPLLEGHIQVQTAFAVAHQIQATPGELFRMQREDVWPDPVGDILATWPEPIVCPVVIP